MVKQKLMETICNEIYWPHFPEDPDVQNYTALIRQNLQPYQQVPSLQSIVEHKIKRNSRNTYI